MKQLPDQAVNHNGPTEQRNHGQRGEMTHRVGPAVCHRQNARTSVRQTEILVVKAPAQ